MPAPNFFSGMTTLQILKAVIGLGSDVQTGSIFPTWSDTVEYCKPDTFWFHEGYLYQSLKESGLQSENGIQVPLNNFEHWKKISYTPLHMGEDELEILNELNTLRIARIGAPQWATSTTAPVDHVLINGDFISFASRPEFKAKYDAGGFAGLLMPYDADAATQAANKGMFRPDAATPTGLYLPVDGGAYYQAWTDAANGTAGGHLNAGLPNINGTFNNYFGGSIVAGTGAITITDNGGNVYPGAGGDMRSRNATFSAQNSNPIYGNSTTVTPDTIKRPVIMYLGRADKILSITTKDKNWAATETEIGFGRVSAPADLALPADQIIDGPAFLAAGTDAINAFVPTCLIGSVFAHAASSTYVPNGCVPANGGEYTQSQFPSFYTDYLITGKLVTCTYAEFATQVEATGNCAKFALDVDNQKFKVPLYKDGDSITHAASVSEVGKSYKAGLPDISGVISGVAGSQTLATGPWSFGGASPGPNLGIVNALSAINFNASKANPIYGNSTTVTDEQVRLRHFVVVASAQNNASVFDWSNYMAALAGKANNDLSNLTPVGTTIIAHNAMPSDRSISYGLVWNNVYEAPADGFFYLSGTATATQQVRMEIYPPGLNNILYSSGGTVMNQTVFGRFLPVKKGYRCVPRGDTVVSTFKFIYAEGSY